MPRRSKNLLRPVRSKYVRNTVALLLACLSFYDSHLSHFYISPSTDGKLMDTLTAKNEELAKLKDEENEKLKAEIAKLKERIAELEAEKKHG